MPRSPASTFSSTTPALRRTTTSASRNPRAHLGRQPVWGAERDPRLSAAAQALQGRRRQPPVHGGARCAAADTRLLDFQGSRAQPDAVAPRAARGRWGQSARGGSGSCRHRHEPRLRHPEGDDRVRGARDFRWARAGRGGHLPRSGIPVGRGRLAEWCSQGARAAVRMQTWNQNSYRRFRRIPPKSTAGIPRSTHERLESVSQPERGTMQSDGTFRDRRAVPRRASRTARRAATPSSATARASPRPTPGTTPRRSP